jgi:alkanesulfonate monooxygenase SsuD/methylene tetrahydromethanopterin reductase-like flavin-dependent oxidoreductase (luciferase family)
MKVGIGLPNAVRGVDRQATVDWAKRAEEAGFSSLGTLDRIAYPNYESLIALAAAAAVTERIGLVTDILIAPLRSNTALLAKQSATIDHMSGGRLELGLAVGGREDDYELSGVDFHKRGARFDRQLRELTDFWAGDAVGPDPANGKRPGLLIGGSSDLTFRRLAQYADGWTMGGGTPDALSDQLPKVRDAWSAAGREGQPRVMALLYFVLGPDAARVAEQNLGDYYAFLGDYAQRVAQSAAKDADTLKGYLSAFEAAGADEVICFPASTDASQVELLAEAVGL